VRGGAALTIEELHADLGALSVQLNGDVVQRLDEIWPGPGKSRRHRPGEAALKAFWSPDAQSLIRCALLPWAERTCQ
jgi:hypothetical protein